MKNQILAASAITLFSSLNTAAADTTESSKTKKSSGTTVITVSRTPIELEKAMAAVTVITRDDIEQSGAHDVTQLLSLQAGIDVARSGGKNSATSFFIRGTESDHIVVLVDGVRVNTATLSSVTWANINVNNIERIEIVRGAKAALYGSEAIGGVISITTNRESGATIQIGTGRYATNEVFARVGHRGEKLRGSIDVAADRSKGFSSYSENSRPNYVGREDDDGSRSRELGLSAGVTMVDNVDADIHYRVSREKVDFDNVGGDEQFINNQETLGLTVKADFEAVLLTATTSNNKQLSGDYYSQQYQTDVQLDVDVSDKTLLTVGGTYADRTGEANSSFDTYLEQYIEKAGFLQLQTELGNLLLTGAGRYVDDGKFGSHKTGNIGLGWAANKNFLVYANYGSAYKAPTLTELFSTNPNFPAFSTGNNDLLPERSITTELGIKAKTSAVDINLSVFDTTIENLINFAFIGGEFKYFNVDETSITGAELRLSGEFRAFDWQLGFTYQDAINKADDKQLLRRPKRKLNGQIAWNWSQHRSALEVLALSERRDAKNEAPFITTNPGYLVANLSQKLQLDENNILTLRLDNVFDKQYESVYGYNSPARSWWLQLTHNINW